MFTFLVVSYFFFVGCSHNKSGLDSLPIIDISRKYSIEKKNLREIADVEYILLETVSESVLAVGQIFISDKYIVINSFEEIFFFSRKDGKYLWKFNRKGKSGEEYSKGFLTVDFSAEECYVYDLFHNKFLVYTYQGDFKRSFPVQKERIVLIPMYDYDENNLIGYNKLSSYHISGSLDLHPYYLINKRDGKVAPLGIEVTSPVSNQLHRESSGERTQILSVAAFSLLQSGDEAFIGDFALDTLYTMRGEMLTPIAVRTPSTSSSDSPLLLGTTLFTDRYIGFSVVGMRFTEDVTGSLDEAPYLYWDRKTKETHRYEFYDSNILSEKRLNLSTLGMQLGQSRAIAYLRADFLVEQYKAGQLRGELKNIASKMELEDNGILVICKFK